jgi:hypothetical protein
MEGSGGCRTALTGGLVSAAKVSPTKGRKKAKEPRQVEFHFELIVVRNQGRRFAEMLNMDMGK